MTFKLPNYEPRKVFLALHSTITLLLFVLAVGCAPQGILKKNLEQQLQITQESNHISGFHLIDASTGEVIFSKNGKMAFTPASVAKIFTLYAALKMLPEQLPVLQYGISGDTVYITGTADPTTLHPDLHDSTALNFLKKYSNVILVDRPFAESAWGPGWSWEDFDQYYSPDRSAMPIYGNILRMRSLGDSLEVTPRLFRDSLLIETGKFNRRQTRNRFLRKPETEDTLDIPFISNPDLERTLWSEALGRPMHSGTWPNGLEAKTLAGMSRDTVCQRMMRVSDNFLAEQLMLQVSSQLGDTLSFNTARNILLQTYLPKIPQKPKWVDGSGLSRYNLFSPETIVYVLFKMYHEIPEEQLFNLMAQGGQNGTLRNWHSETPIPYLYAKSGSMGGVQNVGGYLKTKSGKTLVFASMNNHITGPALPVKQQMHDILRWIYLNY